MVNNKNKKLLSILICADSAFKRQAISGILSSYDNLVIVNISRHGIEAIKSIEKYNPDILILDLPIIILEVLTGFKRLMKYSPTSTIFVLDEDLKTSRTMETRIRNIGFKKFDYVVKQKGLIRDIYPKLEEGFVSKIINLSEMEPEIVRKKKKEFKTTVNIRLKEKNKKKKEVVLDQKPIPISKLETNAIVMGASVGGPKTLKAILKDIPQYFPSPIFVVQHMNHFFMRQFAITLRNVCVLNVKIPENGEEIIPGNIYLSPGEKHMEIIVKNDKPCIRTFEGEQVNFCRPSVDVLFFSAVRVYKENVLGILLTGMGKDGVAGLEAIKSAGGKTIAESQETSVLYGMPKIAADTHAAEAIVPNYEVKDWMITFAKKLNSSKKNA